MAKYTGPAVGYTLAPGNTIAGLPPNPGVYNGVYSGKFYFLGLSGSATLTSTSNITGRHQGAYAVVAGGHNTLTNFGLIGTDQYSLAGVDLRAETLFVNGASGNVFGTKWGVEITSFKVNSSAPSTVYSVSNAGYIYSPIYGIRTLGPATAYVTNSGTIASAQIGIYIAGTVVNSGTLQAKYEALASANYFMNQATGLVLATGTGGAGAVIALSHSGANNGTIEAIGTNGVAVSLGFATFTNAGVVEATGTGGVGLSLGHATLTNSGLIEATGTAGIAFSVSYPATVSGGQILATGSAGVGVKLTSNFSGVLTNASYVHATGPSGAGIYARGGTLINVNTVVATGTGGAGISLNGAVMVTNQSGGVIQGTSAIYDHGTLAVSVANYGTIQGTSTTAGYAVRFGSGNDHLALAPLSVTTGRLNGGTGTSTLELMTDTLSTIGTIAGLGTSITNFALVEVDTQAQWVISGPGLILPTVDVLDAGILTDASTLTNNGRIDVSTGVLILGGPLGGTGTLAISNNGFADLVVGGAPGGTVQFAGAGGTLALGNPLGVSLALTGFIAGGIIDLINVRYSAGTVIPTASAGQLTLTQNGVVVADLQVTGATSTTGFNVHPDAQGGTDLVAALPCFASGTRVRTDRGDINVERLGIGDRVAVRDGGYRPVRWIGHRHVDCRRHPNPASVWPVRIAAGAFGPALPARDLLLSPMHAVWADGVLIPIRYLVNDATIMAVPHDAVTYWHVELDRHDVLFAQDLPCESYLDTGTRADFANGGDVVALYPDFAPDQACELIWEAQGCAPMRVNGEAVARVFAALCRRAALLGATQVRASPVAQPEPSATALPALLDPSWYLAAHPDVAAAGLEAVTHYEGWGCLEGRLPCRETDLIRGLGLIDPATVAITMADVVAAGLDPVEHFCTKGWREHRRPNPYFDTFWYIRTHGLPDGVNPLLHYVLVGERQGLPPSRHFDPVWYRTRHALDVGELALAHFLRRRLQAPTSPVPGFNAASYAAAHAASLLPGRDPYLHSLAQRRSSCIRAVSPRRRAAA